MAAERVPNLFVAGVPKAGTTTLYHDLRKQPAVFFPDKETNALLADDPAQTYSEMSAPPQREIRFGEICPDYTKPVLGERAARAAIVALKGSCEKTSTNLDVLTMSPERDHECSRFPKVYVRALPSAGETRPRLQ